ncbi:MAG TPA: hypothetical protein EYQ64_00155, partial [Gemmatimonadetes bacterium]|nr:hypothetical protein [Gemmatimonadota bacterium]
MKRIGSRLRSLTKGPRPRLWNARSMIALGLSVALCAAALSAEGQIIDAARSGDVDALRSLLAEGADANTTQGDGMTALHWAAERGHSAVAELLLSAGADGEAQTRVGSYTPLHLASRSGYGPIVRTLLDAGADPDATTTNTGVTPLHLAAGAVGGADAVAALLERGATVDAREASSGQTPLMFASAYNRSEAVVVLLQHDADPAVQTKAVDVLRSMAIDREANQRFRDAIDDFRDAEAAGRDWEPSPTNVQAAIRAQREFLLSDYDPGPVDGVSLARVNSEYPGGPSITHPPYRESLVGRTGGMSA